MGNAMRIVGTVAGVFAIVVGIWGIVVHDSAADSQGDITSGFLWVAIGILSLAVAVVALAISQRGD